MNTVVHIYLRRAPAGALLVIRHTFTGQPLPSVTKAIVPLAEKETWLASLLLDENLKAVYSCHNSGATKPEGLGCDWFELPAGHPCERL
jgi:hypothetical protein